MRLKNLLPYYIFALVVASSRLWAGFGQTSGLLLAESLSVRPQGMAGSFSSLGDDESSATINPAGLARLKSLTLGGSQLIALLGAQASHLNFAGPVSDSAGLAGYLGYFYDQDSYRDAYGNEGGTFSNSNWLAGLALGFRLVPGWRGGLGIKALGESYAGSASTSLAGDLGVQGPVYGRIRFGLAAQNLGIQVSQSASGSFALPLRLQGGFSLPFFIDLWRITAEIQSLPQEGVARALFGTEIKLKLNDSGRSKDEALPIGLAIRAGLSSPFGAFDSPRASVGAGLEFAPTYALDYALTSIGDLGVLHRMSLQLRFPGARLERQALPGAELQAPYALEAAETLEGIELSWKDPNEKSEGYNIYADFQIYVEKVTSKPVLKMSQKFKNVERGRAYRFYVRPLGSDGLEGPSSEVLIYRLK